MDRNLGAADRALRVAIGLALLVLVIVGPKTPWGLLGALPLATGLAGLCPIYLMLGYSTAR